MIIGISGKKQSGKSEAAKAICLLGGVAQINFSNSIKNICEDFFGVPRFILYGSNEEKEKPLQIEMGKIINHKSQITEQGWTGRSLMQEVGEVLRRIHPDAIVHAWKRALSLYSETYGDECVVTADVRFLNEIKAIKELGGVVIRLTRAPYAEIDKHPSETALDGMDPATFDAVVDNEGMSVEETNVYVTELCMEKGWL